MQIRTQISVSFNEKNISVKDMIQRLIDLGHLDVRDNSSIGRWMNTKVLPWLRCIRAENQEESQANPLPPIWDLVYPEVYISIDGSSFIVHCTTGPEWPSPYHRTSFEYELVYVCHDKNGDNWTETPPLMNFKLLLNVKTDEPIFVVKGRDPQARRTISDWAVQRHASQHYFDNEVFRLSCVNKANSALRVMEEMRLWKKNNPLVGEADIVGRPNEYTLAHRMSHLLTDAAAVNVRVTVDNKVDPLTGRGQSVVNYRRKRHAASGTYPNPDIKGYVLHVSQEIPRNWNDPIQDVQKVSINLFENEKLIAMSAVPEDRFISEELAEVDAQQA